MKSVQKPYIIIGGGGHAYVIMDLLSSLGNEIMGYVAPKAQTVLPIRYLGDDEWLGHYVNPDDVYLVNGLGSCDVAGNNQRAHLFYQYKHKGFTFKPLIHPSTILGSSVILEEGVQIMAGCVIQGCSNIGKNSIINTSSHIDHHSRIGQHTHIAPGVSVCGGVEIGDYSFVGVGCSIVQNTRVGNNTMVCAGLTITKDICDDQYINKQLLSAES